MTQDPSATFTIVKDGITVSATVPQDFFEEKILPVIEHLVSGMTMPAPAQVPELPSAPEPLAKRDFSVKTIIQHMQTSAALDVLTAAAISLTLVHGYDDFSVKELLKEADTAPSYWTKAKATSADSVIACLKGKGTLVEASNGNLSLGPEAEATGMQLLAAMSDAAGNHPRFTRRKKSSSVVAISEPEALQDGA